jgi:hypothetical protein
MRWGRAMPDSSLMRGLTQAQQRQFLQAAEAMGCTVDALMLIEHPDIAKKLQERLSNAARIAGCTVDALVQIAQTMRRELRKQAQAERSQPADYTGDLAVELDFGKGSSAFPKNQSREEFLAAWKEHQRRVLGLLLNHFAIPHNEPGCWFELSVALARRHVPALQVAKPAGRPKKWGSSQDAVARVTVDGFVDAHPNHSIASAAAHLAKQPPWNEFLRGSKNPGEQLRQAYFRAKPEEVKRVLAALDRSKLSADARANAMYFTYLGTRCRPGG